jgi:hypothetical protein
MLKGINFDNLSSSVSRIAEIYDLTNITKVDNSIFTGCKNCSDSLFANVIFEVTPTKHVRVTVRGQGVHVSKDYSLKYNPKFSLYELILLATENALYRFDDYMMSEMKVAE